MDVYQSKYPKLTGSSYLELERKARQLYLVEVHRTKRNPYVRSRCFNGDKVFLKLFWQHLHQKYRSDRERRLAYYQAALDTIRHTVHRTEARQNPNNKSETVYRLPAKTKDGHTFYIQI